MEVISIQSSVFLFLISDCDVVYAEGNSYLHANLGEMEMCDDKRVIVQKQCLVEQKKMGSGCPEILQDVHLAPKRNTKEIHNQVLMDC